MTTTTTLSPPAELNLTLKQRQPSPSPLSSAKMGAKNNKNQHQQQQQQQHSKHPRADKVARHLLRRHPLQRLPSPSRGSSAFVHILGLASFLYSYSILIFGDSPVNGSYGWHLQYLTIIGLTLSTLTFVMGLLADLTMSTWLFRVKNGLSVASAPMECLISVLYWGLRTIDPKLVEPDWAPPMALYVDLGFHAMPALSLIVDLLLFSPPYTIAFAPAGALSAVIAFGYWMWIERCYAFNNFYPYPIFEMLTTAQRVGLFATSALLMTLATALLIWLYGLVNGRLRNEVSGEPAKGRSGNVKGE